MTLPASLTDREHYKFDSKNRVKVTTLDDNYNTIAHTITEVGTTATPLEFPEITGPGMAEYQIIHRGAASVFIGSDNTVLTTTGFPLAQNEYLKLVFKKKNENNVYAVVASGTIDVHIIATTRE